MYVTGSYLRSLGRLAIPMALQMLIFTSSTAIDAVMIGQLGDAELAGVGLADRAAFLAAMVTVGAANASGTLGAQQLGAQDEAAFRRSVASGMLICGVVGILASIVFWFFSTPILRLGTLDPLVISHGSGYLTIVGLSMASAGILLPLEVGLRCIHRAGIATQYAALEAILNCALNYCLIYGNLGFPALGVEGAALGTLIARVVHVLALVIHVILRVPVLRMKPSDIRRAAEASNLRSYSRIASPLVLNHILWGAGVFAFQLLYGRMGTRELAAMTVLWTFQRFVIVQLAAVGHAGAILVGHAIGGRDSDTARRLSWQNLTVSLVTAGALGVSLLVFREAAVGAFSGLDGATQGLVLSLMPVFLLEVVVRAVTISVIVGALKAGGDVRYALWIDFLGAWLVGIPLAAVGAFVFGWPLPVVYALALGEDISKSILVLLRLRGSAWMHDLAGSGRLDPTSA